MINIKEEQMQNLVDRLEKLEIMGENVLRYWEKDKVQCMLKIKNLDYKIKIAKIEAIEKDRENYKTHINDHIYTLVLGQKKETKLESN